MALALLIMRSPSILALLLSLHVALLLIFHVALLLSLHVALGDGCGVPGYEEDLTTLQPGQCPVPYRKVGLYCYHYALNDSRNWFEGREYCQGIGGDLAVIHSCDDFGALVRDIHMTGQEVPSQWAYWVGGTDLGDEGSWFWLDGVPMALGVPFWGQAGTENEPSGGSEQNCAQLYHDDRYYIHDGVCDLNGYALCQYGVVTRLHL